MFFMALLLCKRHRCQRWRLFTRCSQGVLDAAFTALGDLATEMRKVEKEAEASRATREKVLKEVKAVVECCEEVEVRMNALQGGISRAGRAASLAEEELKVREAKLAAREEELS